MRHGGGSEVLRLRGLYENLVRDALLSLPERPLYMMLYLLYETAQRARDHQEWRSNTRFTAAFLEGRIKKVRGKGQIKIEPQKKTVLT